jgi:hypothetical protein
MTCDCHGLPALWNRDVRYRAGGFWRCAVQKREKAMWRYDHDPVHRIGKILKQNARDRRVGLDRRRAALVNDQEGESDRKVQNQG